MKDIRIRPLSVALAAALACGVALAQSPPTRGPGPGSSVTGSQSAPAAQPGTGTRNAETTKDDKLSRGDRKFVQKAAEGGMFEVQMGQLAATKASDPAVKAFANMLVDDHSKANNELVQLANAKKVELPAGPPRSMRRTLEKIGKKNGSDFDKAFIHDVGVKDHEHDVKDFQKAAKDLKDPELKAFAQKTLPTLQKHLADAKKLDAELKNAAMGNKGR
jgi:putative membrane protein